MKNKITGAQAARYQAGRGVATILGACLPSVALTQPASDSGTFVPERPTAHAVMPFAGFKGARIPNNNMALTAATGGASGSHPNWDPV